MFNYIFKQHGVSIDQGLEWLEQVRNNFSKVIDIYEFQWVNYDFYISFRATSDMAKAVFVTFPGTEKYDKWEIK